MMININ